MATKKTGRLFSWCMPNMNQHDRCRTEYKYYGVLFQCACECHGFTIDSGAGERVPEAGNKEAQSEAVSVDDTEQAADAETVLFDDETKPSREDAAKPNTVKRRTRAKKAD